MGGEPEYDIHFVKLTTGQLIIHKLRHDGQKCGPNININDKYSIEYIGHEIYKVFIIKFITYVYPSWDMCTLVGPPRKHQCMQSLIEILTIIQEQYGVETSFKLRQTSAKNDRKIKIH